MTDRHTDFFVAVGESFCDALRDQPGCGEASPHDFQEVLWNVLGKSFTLEDLQAATSAHGLAQIAAQCARWFEAKPPAESAIRQALESALWRWPPGSLGPFHGLETQAQNTQNPNAPVMPYDNAATAHRQAIDLGTRKDPAP